MRGRGQRTVTANDSLSDIDDLCAVEGNIDLKNFIEEHGEGIHIHAFC